MPASTGKLEGMNFCNLLTIQRQFLPTPLLKFVGYQDPLSDLLLMSTMPDLTELTEDQLFVLPFLEYVSREVQLDHAAIQAIVQHCQLVHFEKGAPILDIGSDSKYVYFIVKGECISFFTDYNGKKTTWFFHFNSPDSLVKNLFAVDYKSFLSKESSTISIDALSDTTAIRFSREDVHLLTNSSSILEKWIRIVNERAFIMIYDRLSTLLTLSASDRYRKFLREEPHLLNMFSNYYIASYLSVAPQSLSRIRKNI